MKTDWTITGVGGQAVVAEGGSMRCQLTGYKMMLWSARNNLVNAEVIGSVKLYASANAVAGFVLRCDVTGDNAYLLRIVGYSPKRYMLYRIVAGVYTLLGQADSVEPQGVYTTIRFRVDGDQVSVEEKILGTWNLIKVCTDGYITAGGYAGLKNESVSGYYAWYDDVTIQERP
uniref:Uncharacterized protein n=1 Tax=viral metagenome TaxID=1070528 RepID=A0A6M3KIN5_9ZZZZ